MMMMIRFQCFSRVVLVVLDGTYVLLLCFGLKVKVVKVLGMGFERSSDSGAEFR